MCVWVEDADKLEINSKELTLVYSTKTIESYLSKKNSYLGLAGVKGQGKTFLIKVKRKSVSEDKSVICLPHNQMVDTIDNSFVIDKSIVNYLKDYNIWVNLWKFSICGAILTSKSLDINFRVCDIKDITYKILSLNNKRSEPTYFLKRLLELNIQELQIVLKDTGKLLDQVRDIHQSICIFIDKLDQGFSNYIKYNEDLRTPIRSRNSSFWQYAQYSLAESAYDIYTNTNHHIKVFYTIRQEALIDSAILNKDKARNINAFIAVLKYNKHDLKNMYNLYIKNEDEDKLINLPFDDSAPSKAFIGVEDIPHGYIKNGTENVFDYIYRHTFKRPYDMMKICRELYVSLNADEEPSFEKIRHIINHASDELLNQYIHELSIFLPCNLSELEQLFKMLPGNILDIELINSICHMHYIESNLNNELQCNQNCINCEKSQVFTLLYNIGLLGSYKQHATDEYPKIYFENIGNSVLDLKRFVLPKSNHYYLHPALSNRVRDLRGKIGLKYNITTSIVIGDEYAVVKDNYKGISKDINNNKKQLDKERIFISSTINDLKEERDKIKELLKKAGLHPIMSEEYNFDVDNTQQVHSHDHCLNIIKRCQNCIFIVGESYGGFYSGNIYLDERKEIIALSEGKISQPSISLMEFYIARKKGLNCYVFANEKLQQLKAKGALDENIKKELDFINHFKLSSNEKIKGNWISWYNGVEDLLKRIGLCKLLN